MGRTIKFRGKSLIGLGWIFGDLEYCRKKGGRAVIHRYYENGDYMGQNAVEYNTVGQFSGLYDKNGKEIYEGDIVCYDDTPYCAYGNKYKGEVVVYRGAWCVKHHEECCDEYFYSPLFADDFASNKTTILGNVIENPELLQ